MNAVSANIHNVQYSTVGRDMVYVTEIIRVLPSFKSKSHKIGLFYDFFSQVYSKVVLSIILATEKLAGGCNPPHSGPVSLSYLCIWRGSSQIRRAG